MINNINFESNCKRIAKYINDNVVEPEVVMTGNIFVWISAQLLDDFNAVGEKAYEKEVNKHLKDFKVKYVTKGLSRGWYLKFQIIE